MTKEKKDLINKILREVYGTLENFKDNSINKIEKIERRWKMGERYQINDNCKQLSTTYCRTKKEAVWLFKNAKFDFRKDLEKCSLKQLKEYYRIYYC